MQRPLAYVPEALESIWRNRTRSLLSILGMVIGIASVIAVLGLSQAASGGIKAELSQGGDPGFLVVPDQSQDDPAIARLYYRDVALVQSYAPDAVEQAIPLYVNRGQMMRASGKAQFIGMRSTRSMARDTAFQIASGRLIDDADVAAGANVCVLSTEAAQKLFPAGGAVGNTINIGNVRAEIVGVFVMKGSLLASSLGEIAFLPYTTMHRIQPGPIDIIQFWPTGGTSGVDAIAAVRSALARIHPHAKYLVQDQAAALGVFERVLASIGIGLTIIGGISLFVAGVGIMNIMLVSVAERTREIGIRKSIGASAEDIWLQFLIEASALSIFGGALGTLLGAAIVVYGCKAIVQALGSAPVPWVTVIAVALGFSLTVGIAFGSYPAARAGQLDPVEALRS